MHPNLFRKGFVIFLELLFIGVNSYLPSSLLASPPVLSEITSVVPVEDTNAIFHNPGMGWVIYENYPVDPDPHGSSTMLTLSEDDFPEADAVAIMFSWQDIEASEDVYDFSRVDRAYDYWRKRAKEIQLRVSSESLLWWSKRTPAAGKGVPDYVLARMGEQEKQTRQMEGESYVVVDARNRFYQERLAAFLRALNQHFRGERPVTLIDLRGFGLWGEWHSGFRYPNLEARRNALKAVLDIWSEGLPQHTLALSYSYDPDGPKALYAGSYKKYDAGFTTNYDEFLRFSAFDYALGKTNISFRRDGCGGAVHSNERKLNEEAFSKYHRAPMFCEFLGSYSSVKNAGSNWVSWMVEDALSLHPNYIALLGWQGGDARAFTRERRDLIDLGLMQMGYRLLPTRVRYPASITNGVSFQIQFDWVNRGVGRALLDYELELLFKDQDGITIARSGPFTLSTSRWVRGETHEISQAAKFSNVKAGDYQLALAVHDPVSKRAIALPLREKTGDGAYKIGNVRVAVGFMRR